MCTVIHKHVTPHSWLQITSFFLCATVFFECGTKCLWQTRMDTKMWFTLKGKLSCLTFQMTSQRFWGEWGWIGDKSFVSLHSFPPWYKWYKKLPDFLPFFFFLQQMLWSVFYIHGMNQRGHRAVNGADITCLPPLGVSQALCRPRCRARSDKWHLVNQICMSALRLPWQ